MRLVAGSTSKALAAVSCFAFMVGCANVNKEQGGTAIGAIVGAVVGKKVGGDRGMVLGAVAGGLLGNRIGAHLDEQDRQRLVALEKRALDTGAGGSFITNKTKATVTVEASAGTTDKRTEFALSRTLTPHALAVIDPVAVTAFVDTPIYNTLSELDKPKMVIQKGVPLRIAANVVNENWAVVGEGNVGIGYVPRRYLDAGIVQVKQAEARARARPAPDRTATASARPTTVGQGSETKTAASTQPAMSKEQFEQEMEKLHAAYKPRESGTTAAPTRSSTGTTGSTGQPDIQVVQASTECKTVSRKVEAAGQPPFVESVKYCKEPPKGWQTQTV